MTHSPHYASSLLPPSPSTHSPPTNVVRPQHDDFLGTPSQEYHLQDTLGLGLNFDYSFNLADESHLPSDLPSDATAAHPNDYASWPPQYPQHSLLFGTTNTSPYLADLSLSSPTPPAVHDSYGFHGAHSLYNSPSISRDLPPRIRIETELHTMPSSGSHYPHSPYHTLSPSGHSPSAILPTPTSSGLQSSPSSTGSVPPVTPDTPYKSVSPGTSPYITRPSPTPISPHCISVPTAAFNPKDSYLTPLMREPVSVLELASMAGHPAGGVLVPQKTYRPHTLSDRRRYVEEVQLEEPIMFYTHNPIGCGILLKDAINSRFSGLEGRDDAMFVGRGPSVSIRLNWPGYAPWSRQIPTRDFRSPPHPITRAKLARNVAKTIQRFIQDMETQAMEDASEIRWRVGSKGIKLEDLILVGLQHVSMGSWQAHVRLVRRH